MARQNKSLAGLADTLGKTQATARSRRDGRTPFDMEEIARVADWLGVDISALTNPLPTAAGA